ncbi:MAG: glycerol-3-phosphate dehydrogenase/oxidase [Bacteroidota bacterium]|nr:glycerol-3-phosphate dehydrogenase/oxidase [Bacteroidota bacterium]
MNRLENLEKAKHNSKYDVVVIGGGATGLGAAVEAVTRGYKTVLVEQHDFAKGTSSRSTKLVHGGVRYLAQGDIMLVLEALRERGLLLKNAPHLVKDQKFVIPSYTWWGVPFYTIGLTMYDLLAGKLGFGRSLPYSKKRTLKCIPTLIKEKLRGGVLYHDGQFDDSRLAINLAQTFVEKGGTILNYSKVTGLHKDDKGDISGVKIKDMQDDSEYSILSKSVLNATGVFVDDIVKMDESKARDIVKSSQGVHLVLDKSFCPNDYAIMIPATSDGRVLFAVPWHNKIVLGTTDVQKEKHELEPKALEEEVDFILETAARFLLKPPKRSDVLSIYAGLRPLAAPTGEGKKTKEISRSHKIIASKAKLVTIIGGKWTTYRQMGEDVIDRIEKEVGFAHRKTQTKKLHVHGYKKDVDLNDPLYFYGTDKENILKIASVNKEMKEFIHPKFDIIKAQIVWAVKEEMAITVEDFLARRTRALILDARASIESAPIVAEVMAKELGEDTAWIEKQVKDYIEIAKGYILI